MKIALVILRSLYLSLIEVLFYVTVFFSAEVMQIRCCCRLRPNAFSFVYINSFYNNLSLVHTFNLAGVVYNITSLNQMQEYPGELFVL